MLLLFGINLFLSFCFPSPRPRSQVSFHSLSISVFVSSKSYIYITANDASALPQKVPSVIAHNHEPALTSDPIYQNIENGNIVPSDDNKFTIYVNYDEIKGQKSKNNKSSVRLLEPDVVKVNDNWKNDDDDVNDEDNDIKTMSKMIQCQQISMYIGEKKKDVSCYNYQTTAA